MKKKKVFKYRKTLNAILVVISLYFIYNVYNEVMITLNLQAEIDDAKVIIEKLEKKNKILNDEKGNLENEEYVLRYARGKYNVNKDGEQLFRLPD